MTIKHSLLAGLAICLSLTACKKDVALTEQERDQGIERTQDYLEASQVFQNLFDTMDKEAKQQGDLNGFTVTEEGVKTRNNCPEVSFAATETTIFPATLALDYTEGGCTTTDNKSAAGKVTMTFTGLLLKEGTAISMIFDNFAFDGYQVNGIYQISNDGKDGNGFLTFTAKVIDGELIDPAGKIIKHASTSVRKFIEGAETNFFTNGWEGIVDDVWSITETATGISKDGISYDISTAKDLRVEVGCKWPVSGRFEVNLSEPDIISAIDFGDGTCDNKAMLEINDYMKEIEL